ncbi:MAG TPA: hypothetical protein VFJ02_09220 [Vicinamibacterales bacterium]|nr:hypothetical protein [Vicinamibacterales bacterium]
MVLSRVMLLLFLAAQGFDGLFTYAAVSAYGLHAEGNVIIATWMAIVGPAAALFGAKTVAGACGVFLYLRGMHRTLSLLTAVYGVAAIGPWLMVFLRH